MSSYKVATGHDVALVSLTTISPQPRSTGVRTTRRTFGADGSVHDEGRFIILQFDFSDDPTTYVALLTLFGVQNDLFADVTIYVPDERLSYVRYNGTAVRPEPGKDMTQRQYFPRDIEILIKDIFAAS